MPTVETAHHLRQTGQHEEARALLLRPRLLLADEPTGNLDTKTGREMHELFFELNRELEMTILIVTHNDELAARTPRRLRMADGVIVEQE